MRLVQTLLTIYAAALAVCGLALVFAPAEVGALAVAGGIGETAVAQILGAAFLGFATAAWTARTSVLGGIYGRAVVAGAQVFTVVGALSAIGGAPGGARAGYWVLVAVLVVGAALFGWLLYRGPRLPRQPA